MSTLTRTPSSPAPTPRRLYRVITDRVLWAMVLMIASLALIDAPQLAPSLRFTATALVDMLPFFALAVAIAAVAKATGADTAIARAFGGHPLRATLLAALVGALSPFCSCGVIPLIAAMLSAGVPLAAVMAFWIASPIMDPEMFVLTAAGIGPGFALAKTLAAIAMGAIAGTAVLALQRSGRLNDPLRRELDTCGGGSCGADNRFSGGDVSGIAWRFWQRPERIDIFRAEALAIGVFLGKWLTLAFFLESLMLAYVSSAWIAAHVGADNPWAIPLAALVGAPTYLNGYAAIPLISGLLDIGMTPGAAMAFATAGAVSSIPAAIAVWALVKKPVFALYLGLGFGGAMLSGWIYQLAGAPV